VASAGISGGVGLGTCGKAGGGSLPGNRTYFVSKLCRICAERLGGLFSVRRTEMDAAATWDAVSGLGVGSAKLLVARTACIMRRLLPHDAGKRPLSEEPRREIL
jgi:hypothetical protein